MLIIEHFFNIFADLNQYNSKLGSFIKFNKNAFLNNLTFCWMGKLSGKPVTPFT